MTTAVLMGGPLNGESVEVAGVRALWPVLTAEHMRERAAWTAEYAVAWAFETIDGIPEHPRTPPPPPWPEAVYEWQTRDDGSIVGIFTGWL